jgi:hypothetical protein
MRPFLSETSTPNASRVTLERPESCGKEVYLGLAKLLEWRELLTG